MKNLILAFFILSQFAIQAQKHFSLSMKLTVQSDTVYCDLIANEDYPLIGFQFGFIHNSDQVEFLDIEAKTLPGIDKLKYNEICPKHVRMLWTSPIAKNHLVKKDDVLFTLIYKEIMPTNHFICMMQSSGSTGGNCTNFRREVFATNDVLNQIETYIVDDICINYEIQNGQAIVATEGEEEKNNINVCLNGQCDKLLIDSDDYSNLNDVHIQLININGKECINLKLESTINQQIDISKYPSGIYVYKIFSGNKNLKTGKIFFAK